MSRRRSRRRDYNATFQDRQPGYSRPSEVYFRTSSPWDELDTLVRAAPALAPIHRIHPELDPGDLMSSPAPISLPEAASWLDYPPRRSTLVQERRKRPGGTSPSGYSSALLLRPFFRTPESTKVCVRRKERREVIMATQGGGRGMPPRRRSEASNYSC